MNKILFLVFGLVLTIIGFRVYSYFEKNLESIDNKPGNLYGIAVLLIFMGIIAIILSIINFF